MTLSAIQALMLVQLFGSILGNDEKIDNYFLLPLTWTIITEHTRTRGCFFPQYVQFYVNVYALREGNNPCRNLFLPPLPPLALFPPPFPLPTSTSPFGCASAGPRQSPSSLHVLSIRCAMPSISLIILTSTSAHFPLKMS